MPPRAEPQASSVATKRAALQAGSVATCAGRIPIERILRLVCEQQPQASAGATKASSGYKRASAWCSAIKDFCQHQPRAAKASSNKLSLSGGRVDSGPAKRSDHNFSAERNGLMDVGPRSAWRMSRNLLQGTCHNGATYHPWYCQSSSTMCSWV